VKLIDIAILAGVVLAMGLILYFRFIKNRGKAECANCAKVNRYKMNRLRAYYEKAKKAGE